jgi:hypothetical protein
MTSSAPAVPFFKWAQDADHLFVAIDLPDVTEQKIDLTADSFSFRGVSKSQPYELKFDFLKKINPDTSKMVKHRLVEFLLAKADDSTGFWGHLLKEKDKFKSKCKVDFDKWVDEDEDAKLADKMDFSRFGGMGGDDEMGGMPGMGGMGGMPPGMMGGMPPGMMGGMPGMGGMGGMPGMGGMGGPGGFDMAKMMEMMKARGAGAEDDEDVPDSIGDTGDLNFGGDKNEPDSDDDDLPDLQPEDNSSKK